MTTTNSPDQPSHIVFIELLRGVASLLVVWDHLVGIWNTNNKHLFLPLELVRTYITKPLGIIQDFGYLGVAIFFFVSGFIITHVAQREDRPSFIIKRMFRIYPPLIVSILIIVVVTSLYVQFVNAQAYPEIIRLSPAQILFAMTLWNYLFAPQNVVNGVAWSLVIEEIFYAICWLLLPWLRTRPRLATILCSLTVFVILWNSRAFGSSFFLLAASTGFIPLLLIGQITYLLWSRRIRLLEFAALFLVNYLLFNYSIATIHTKFLDINNSYMLSSAYAYAIFLICLLLNDRIIIPRILKFYSAISYSMYLNHGSNGLTLITLLFPAFGYIAALLVALGSVTGLSYLSWRYVERPAQVAARALIARWRAAKAKYSHGSVPATL